MITREEIQRRLKHLGFNCIVSEFSDSLAVSYNKPLPNGILRGTLTIRKDSTMKEFLMQLQDVLPGETDFQLALYRAMFSVKDFNRIASKYYVRTECKDDRGEHITKMHWEYNGTRYMRYVKGENTLELIRNQYPGTLQDKKNQNLCAIGPVNTLRFFKQSSSVELALTKRDNFNAITSSGNGIEDLVWSFSLVFWGKRIERLKKKIERMVRHCK